MGQLLIVARPLQQLRLFRVPVATVRAQQLHVQRGNTLRHKLLLVAHRFVRVERVRKLGRIHQIDRMVQPVVDEPGHHGEKVAERFHNAQVDHLAAVRRVREVVRHDPRHRFALDLRLEVVALDRDEHFAQGLGRDHVVHKLHRQPAAHARQLARNDLRRRERAEHEQQRHAVVQLLDRVDERRVALLHDVVQLQLRVVVQPYVAQVHVLLRRRMLDAPVEDLPVAQRPHDRLVQQEGDVLLVVQDLHLARTVLRTCPVLRFARIDALQDAQLPEVFDVELQLVHGGLTGVVHGTLARFELVISLHHRDEGETKTQQTPQIPLKVHSSTCTTDTAGKLPFFTTKNTGSAGAKQNP
uniref:Uncharacterized protein n=1 Tax=Anopheles quadriannulatus TaxID=34691 RepID=A0A182WWX9_ANOQN